MSISVKDLEIAIREAPGDAKIRIGPEPAASIHIIPSAQQSGGRDVALVTGNTSGAQQQGMQAPQETGGLLTQMALLTAVIAHYASRPEVAHAVREKFAPAHAGAGNTSAAVAEGNAANLPLTAGKAAEILDYARHRAMLTNFPPEVITEINSHVDDTATLRNIVFTSKTMLVHTSSALCAAYVVKQADLIGQLDEANRFTRFRELFQTLTASPLHPPFVTPSGAFPAKEKDLARGLIGLARQIPTLPALCRYGCITAIVNAAASISDQRERAHVLAAAINDVWGLSSHQRFLAFQCVSNVTDMLDAINQGPAASALANIMWTLPKEIRLPAFNTFLILNDRIHENDRDALLGALSMQLTHLALDMSRKKAEECVEILWTEATWPAPDRCGRFLVGLAHLIEYTPKEKQIARFEEILEKSKLTPLEHRKHIPEPLATSVQLMQNLDTRTALFDQVMAANNKLPPDCQHPGLSALITTFSVLNINDRPERAPMLSERLESIPSLDKEIRDDDMRRIRSAVNIPP